MIRKQSMTIMFALAFMIFTPIAASAQTTQEVVPSLHKSPIIDMEVDDSIFTITWDLETTDDFVGFQGRYYVQELDGTIIEDWQNLEKECPNDFGGSCGPFIETATGAMYLHGHQNDDVLRHCVEITANFENDSTKAIECAVSQQPIPTPIPGAKHKVVVERNHYKAYPGEETIISGYVLNYIQSESNLHEVKMKILQKNYQEFVYLPLDEDGRFVWTGYLHEMEQLVEVKTAFKVYYVGHKGSMDSVLVYAVAPLPAGPDDFRVVVTTDKEQYTMGETVIVTATVFNWENSEHGKNRNGFYVTIDDVDGSKKVLRQGHGISNGPNVYVFEIPEDHFDPGKFRVAANPVDGKVITYIHMK